MLVPPSHPLATGRLEMELEVEEALEEEAEEEGKASRGVTIQIRFLFRTTKWLLARKLGGLIVI